MADFYICYYSKTLKNIRREFDRLVQKYPSNRFELWTIEPDKYDNRFVVVDRKKVRGRPPKNVFLKRVVCVSLLK